ncbi:hypothetical protein DPMN_024455 [Dreissena polymorpha]|uniref:Uncharacterized protein n=1 Tax=Dreissena polymorpha TaxID=45954 RepID=A0A9D4RBL6_DREPO|nr:hypothetical protein DPMN_024455 [Dreissena polymorpha]
MVYKQHNSRTTSVLGQQLERARRDQGESHPQRIFLEGTSAGGSANPAESATLEPDVFHIAGIAVFPKMQRSRQPLFIRDGDSGTTRSPVWRKYGADLGLLFSSEQSLEHRGGGPIERPWDGGTQYAQRAGETVSGMKTTAGDFERGHKGRAASCRPLGAASRQNFVYHCTLRDIPLRPDSPRFGVLGHTYQPPVSRTSRMEK